MVVSNRIGRIRDIRNNITKIVFKAIEFIGDIKLY